MTNLTRPGVLISLVAVLVFSARAQTVPNEEAGLKPFGSFEGGAIDSVNLLNGNLTIQSPLFHYAQRGAVTFDVRLRYHNRNFKAINNCDPWTGECHIIKQWIGGGVLIQFLWGPTAGINVQNIPNGQIYYATTQDGSVHQMIGNNAQQGYQTMDGEGIYFNGVVENQVTRLRDGKTRRSTSNSVYVSDTNGNKITSTTPGQIVYTDTLGRASTSVYSTNQADFAGCTGQWPIVESRTFSMPGPSGTTRYIRVCTIYVRVHVPGGYDYRNGGGIPDVNTTTYMNQSVVLYNGTSWTNSPAWTFHYAVTSPSDTTTLATGDLTQITLPTGGTISYAYADGGVQCGPSGDLGIYGRRVLSRSVDAHDGTGLRTTKYDGITITSPTPLHPGRVVTDASGNDVLHEFIGLGGTCSYYETTTKWFQGTYTSGTLLKTQVTDYSHVQNPLDFYGDGTTTAINVHPIRTTTTWPNGKVTKTERDYDSNLLISGGSLRISYGNLVEERVYDYGNGTPGPLLRRTRTDYKAFSDSNYLAGNLLDLPSAVTVYNGSGAQLAKTTYGYDGFALSPSGITTQHDSLANPGFRGNLTSVGRWLNTTGGTLTTTTKYHDTGMPYQVTDALGRVTTFSYSSVNAGAYVTQTDMPDTGSPAVRHRVSGTYDFNTGLLASFTDQNAQTSNYTYDAFGRIASLFYPDGGQTTFTYADIPDNSSVERRRKIDSSRWIDFFVYFDGLGRQKQTRLASDSDGAVLVDTTYDALGRQAMVSNPHRDGPSSTDGTTTYYYDALGRTCLVVPPDGTLPSGSTCPSTQPPNTIFTTYSGNTTTVTDQAGKSRKSVTDALGRLTQVLEDPAGLNYETAYTYDALDNLTRVDQKGNDPNPANWRTRTFTYDSLSWLKSASNPESGTITYTYDNAGNVLTKTAPKPNQTGALTVTATYTYDALNRLAQKSYNDGLTATVQYGYDGAAPLGCTPPALTIANGIGRRTGMCDAAGAEAWSYDITPNVGWKTTDARTTNGVTKTFVYQNNMDGSLATLTYPNGEALVYASGGAGRPLSAIGSATYATNVRYAPNGALCNFQTFWGNTFTHNYTYNNRFQPVRMQVYGTGYGSTSSPCTASTDTLNTQMNLTYNFVDANGNNNGNVVSITNNVDGTRSQTFTYDFLNRLATAQTTSTYATCPANCWGETFGYDPWGNLLTISPVSSSYNGCTQENLNVGATPKNQLSGYGYDAAGNMTSIPGIATYTYNAENQLVSTGGVTYTYDGDGKRVIKSNGTIYWYGTGSDPLLETNLSGNFKFQHYYFNGMRVARREANNWVDHYALDHLGNARWVYGNNGAGDVSDYYPFGGERPVQSNAGNKYKFTSKERDSESALDHFGARHYTSAMGRWLSPDRLNVTDDRLEIPSSTLNKYVYGANNPFRFVDPDGRDIVALYNPPHEFRPGHFMLFANNPQTGESALMSFGPRDRSRSGEAITAVGGFQESTKEFKLPTSADELRQNFAALTIQTTPEQAQEVINFIKNFDASNTNYKLFSQNCATVCRDALKIVGLLPRQAGNITPAGLWDTLYSRYGRKNLFQQIFAPNVGPRRTGIEYGDPRFGMNTFDFLWLQVKPPRACTTIRGPGGLETQCVD